MALQKRAIEWAKKILDYGQETLTVKEKVWRFLTTRAPGRGPERSPWHAGAHRVQHLHVLHRDPPSTTSTSRTTRISSSSWRRCASRASPRSSRARGHHAGSEELLFDSMNQVDAVAILPFYLELILADVTIPGLSVFRVVRLVRVFRLFKMSRGPSPCSWTPWCVPPSRSTCSSFSPPSRR